MNHDWRCLKLQRIDMPMQDLNPVPRSQPSTTDTDFKLPRDVRVRLESELALAEQHLSVALSEFWPSAFRARLAGMPRTSRDLFPVFNAFAISIVLARGNALVALGNDVLATAELIEDTVLPHTIKILLPTVLDSEMWRDQDLRETSFDPSPLGYWEVRICSSWEGVQAKGDLFPDPGRDWCLPFQRPLRFAANRNELIESLEAQLKESLISWKADAWAILPCQQSPPGLSPFALQAVLETGAFDIAARSKQRILVGALDREETIGQQALSQEYADQSTRVHPKSIDLDASGAPSGDGDSNTKAVTYKERWHLLGADRWAEGAYRNVAEELVVAVGFKEHPRALDTWLDVVRDVVLDEYPATRPDPYYPKDDGKHIDEIHKVSQHVCGSLRRSARQKGNLELWKILKEFEDRFNKLECRDLYALLLHDLPEEEHPELYHYLEAPSAADVNRSGPATGNGSEDRHDQRATDTQAVAERAARRHAVVMPILTNKRWKRGRLATEAGLGKNSVYEYLDGTRVTITDENRKAIADALGLKPEQIPD